MFGNLSAALIVNRRIITTLAKAKYARGHVERMITFARSGEVADRRHVLRYILDKAAVKVLFDDIGPHFKNRNGGYTRIIKLGTRRGDAAQMAMLELVGFDDIAETTKKTTGKSRLKTAQSESVKAKTDKDKTVSKDVPATPENAPEVDSGAVSEDNSADNKEKSAE